MPKEIFDKDKFIELSKKASKCTVKKLGEETKLKLRTGTYLYTIRLEASEANSLLGQINCPKEEL